MTTRINEQLVRWTLLVLMLGLTSSVQAAVIIGPKDTLNLNSTIFDDVLNQGTLVVVWSGTFGGTSTITGTLDNVGVTRLNASDASGGFNVNSTLSVNGGIQNTGTMRFETWGQFGNSGGFTNLAVGFPNALTNLPGGLIETTVHAGAGTSGNAISAQLQNQGTLNHNANTTLNIFNSLNDLVGADHVNAGAININAGALNVFDFNSFTNNGTIQGRSITLTGIPNGIQPGFTSAITNSNLVDMTAGNFVTVGLDSFTNTVTGQINLTGGDGSVSHFNSFVNQGGITIGTGRTFGLGGGLNLGIAENQASGVIDGNGTLSLAATTTFTNLGTIAPGSSFGTMTIVGGFAQGTSGILDMEVGGLDPGVTYDQLIMSTGTATLGGTLRLRFQGFAPSTSDSFLLIDGSVLGSFDQVELLGIQPGAQFSIDTSSGFLLTALNDWAIDPGLPEDTNGDGVVNVLDLIDVLLCFGLPAVPGCEAEDVDGDGTVNVLDLIDVLLAFGTTSP